MSIGVSVEEVVLVCICRIGGIGMYMFSLIDGYL